MALRALAVVSLAAVLCAADQKSLDCPLRQIGLDFAKKLQPFRSAAAFKEVADALNGAEEAQHCSVKVGADEIVGAGASLDSAIVTAPASAAAASRVLSYPLPTSGHVIFVDPRMAVGSDLTGTGAMASPFRSIERAMEEVRAVRAKAGHAVAANAPRSTIVLRAGVFHLTATLQVTPDDSQLTFQAYPGEEVGISGTTPLTGVSWTPYTAPARPAYEYRPGGLTAGFDVMAEGPYTLASAITMCDAMPACAAFSYNSSSPSPSGTVTVSFKHAVFYVKSNAASTWVKNVGYGATGPKPNVYVADVSAAPIAAAVDGVRVSGVRGIRARYPNAGTAELLGAMQIVADRWIPQKQSTKANSTFNPASPLRPTAAQNFFQVGRATSTRIFLLFLSLFNTFFIHT